MKKNKLIYNIVYSILILLIVTSCNKEKTTIAPTTTSISVIETETHTLIDNNKWQVHEDSYYYGTVENHKTIYGLEDGVISLLEFYTPDSVSFMVFIGNWDDYGYTDMAHFEHKTGIYSIDENMINIASDINYQFKITTVLDSNIIMIDFYSPIQTLKFKRYDY